MQANEVVNKFLINGSSSKDMNVDGSSTPVAFVYQAPTNMVVKLEDIVLGITDAAITIDKFGGLAALSNGLLIQITDASDNVVVDFLDSDSIKTNDQFVLLAADVGTNITAGSTTDLISVHWSFHDRLKDCVLAPGQKLKITVRDNLTGLTSFRTFVRGYTFDVDL